MIKEYNKYHKTFTIRYVLTKDEHLKEGSYHFEWKYKGKKYSNDITTKIVKS
jgi:outer membrane biogenesis lipoprotein LolB